MSRFSLWGFSEFVMGSCLRIARARYWVDASSHYALLVVQSRCAQRAFAARCSVRRAASARRAKSLGLRLRPAGGIFHWALEIGHFSLAWTSGHLSRLPTNRQTLRELF